jgi:hypothetical protein
MKEPIPEVDEAIGVEELTIKPGAEVWHKIYNLPMIVQWVSRYNYSKQLEYGCVYMVGDTEVAVNDVAYSFIPMEQVIDVYPDSQGKVGACDIDLGEELSFI